MNYEQQLYYPCPNQGYPAYQAAGYGYGYDNGYAMPPGYAGYRHPLGALSTLLNDPVVVLIGIGLLYLVLRRR